MNVNRLGSLHSRNHASARFSGLKDKLDKVDKERSKEAKKIQIRKQRKAAQKQRQAILDSLNQSFSEEFKSAKATFTGWELLKEIMAEKTQNTILYKLSDDNRQKAKEMLNLLSQKGVIDSDYEDKTDGYWQDYVSYDDHYRPNKPKEEWVSTTTVLKDTYKWVGTYKGHTLSRVTKDWD